jgi:hypothetical protein
VPLSIRGPVCCQTIRGLPFSWRQRLRPSGRVRAATIDLAVGCVAPDCCLLLIRAPESQYGGAVLLIAFTPPRGVPLGSKRAYPQRLCFRCNGRVAVGSRNLELAGPGRRRCSSGFTTGNRRSPSVHALVCVSIAILPPPEVESNSFVGPSLGEPHPPGFHHPWHLLAVHSKVPPAAQQHTAL